MLMSFMGIWIQKMGPKWFVVYSHKEPQRGFARPELAVKYFTRLVCAIPREYWKYDGEYAKYSMKV